MVIFFIVELALAYSYLPTLVEPVKAILRIAKLSSSVGAMSLEVPVITLNTPAGIPAS